MLSRQMEDTFLGVFLLLGLTAAAHSDDSVPCPTGWTAFNQFCYFSGPEEPCTYDAAKENCITLGGHLVSVHSSSETAFICSNMVTQACWIGLNDIEEEGQFVWEDNSPLDYTNWIPGEPNNHNTMNVEEDCVLMYCDSTAGAGVWNDFACSDGDYYIVYLCKGNPPAAAVHLTATSTNGLVSLSWTAPSDEGSSSLSKYRVRITSNSNTEYKEVQAPTTEWTGTLSSGVTYTFSVAARNGLDVWGPESDSINHALPSENAVACPADWREFDSHCYMFRSDKRHWQSAVNDCISFGGHLVSIHSTNENDVVVEFLLNVWSRGTRVDSWTGFNNIDDVDTWSWEDGSVVDFKNWYHPSNEPNQPTETHCGSVMYDGENRLGGWNDDWCEKSALFSTCMGQPPSKCSNLRISSSSSRATVTWNMPMVGGSSSISRYRVAIISNGNVEYQEVQAPSTSWKGTLSDGVTYSFSVAARNRLDVWGPESDSVTHSVRSSLAGGYVFVIVLACGMFVAAIVVGFYCGVRYYRRRQRCYRHIKTYVYDPEAEEPIIHWTALHADEPADAFQHRVFEEIGIEPGALVELTEKSSGNHIRLTHGTPLESVIDDIQSLQIHHRPSHKNASVNTEEDSEKTVVVVEVVKSSEESKEV